MRLFVIVGVTACWTGAPPRVPPRAIEPPRGVRLPHEGTWELPCRGDAAIHELACRLHRESSDETLLSCLIAEDPEHLAVGEMWLRVDGGELSWYFDPPNEKAPSVVKTTRKDDATTTCVRNDLSDGASATLCWQRSGALVGLGAYGLTCGRVSS